MTRFDTGNVIVHAYRSNHEGVSGGGRRAGMGQARERDGCRWGGSSGSGSDAPVTPSTGEQGYTG